MDAETATPGPWEPFLNSTFNGQYWALRRRNPKFWGGEEVAQTRGWKPCRFGSEEAARTAADKANAAAAAVQTQTGG